MWNDHAIARLEAGKALLAPRIKLVPALARMPTNERVGLIAAIEGWLEQHCAERLRPLRRLAEAINAPDAGPELRAVILKIIEAGGAVPRGHAGLEALDSRQRDALRKLGVRIGGLDVYVPLALRPAAMQLWSQFAGLRGLKHALPPARMAAVLPEQAALPGYRRAAAQLIRVDLADKLVQSAHRARIAAPRRRFALDPSLARSMGLSAASFAVLLRSAGFRANEPRSLPEGASGPSAPPLWEWRAPRPPEPRVATARTPRPGSAFAALAELIAL